nr:hypothetical protein [Tanacetum cinerariifolium]
LYVELALQAEQELKTRPNDDCLLRDLSYYKGKIDSIAKIFIARGQLSSDWKYQPDIASSYMQVPNE